MLLFSPALKLNSCTCLRRRQQSRNVLCGDCVLHNDWQMGKLCSILDAMRPDDNKILLLPTLPRMWRMRTNG